MSDGALALLGVVIGAVLSPLVQAVGYLVRRQIDRDERRRAERRQALYDLQDALVDLTRAWEATMQVHGPESWQEGRERSTERAVAARLVRVRAARVGDARLWELVHPPGVDWDVMVAVLPSGTSPGSYARALGPPDDLDAVNERVRELLAEL